MYSIKREFHISAVKWHDEDALAILDDRDVTYGGAAIKDRNELEKMLGIIQEAYNAGCQHKEFLGFSELVSNEHIMLRGVSSGYVYCSIPLSVESDPGELMESCRMAVERAYKNGESDNPVSHFKFQ